jgi:predicted TIM-barrel fold metal-dependent hydrolase
VVALPFLGTAPALSLSQMVLSGVFDRLPGLQIFFAETLLGWVPFWMEEADYWYERHRHWSERLLNWKPLRQRPSEYVRQHVHFSVQHVERVAVELRHHMGVDHIMFATDFRTSMRLANMAVRGALFAGARQKPSRSRCEMLELFLERPRAGKWGGGSRPASA